MWLKIFQQPMTEVHPQKFNVTASLPLKDMVGREGSDPFLLTRTATFQERHVLLNFWGGKCCNFNNGNLGLRSSRCQNDVLLMVQKSGEKTS